MKRILAGLAATVLVATLSTPMMAADSSSTPSSGAAASGAATAPTGGEAGSAASPAPKSKSHSHKAGLHRKKKHRMLHHAHSLDKGKTPATPAPSN